MIALNCAARVHEQFKSGWIKVFRGAPSRAVSIILTGEPGELRSQMRDLEWVFAFRLGKLPMTRERMVSSRNKMIFAILGSIVLPLLTT